MKRLCVIDVPGLSRDLLRYVPEDSALGKWLKTQRVVSVTPTWPTVTCSMQATLTTGKPPAEHGIIANGLATFRSPEDQELVDASNFASYRQDISFWEQSNQFLQVPRFWQIGKLANSLKTALICVQQSMPGFSGTLRPAADIVLTPKPEHGPEGKITSLCWAEPATLIPELFGALGPFPLMNYWGPMAGIASSNWIAKAAAHIFQNHTPGFQFTYIPHLDYDLQRFGPGSEQARKAVVDLAGALEPLIAAVHASDGQLALLSEYAIHPVDRAIFPNRILREADLLQTHDTPDGALVDYEKSGAFAMVDHQIAHVYTAHPSAMAVARRVLEDAGLEILDGKTLAHPRAGELLIQAPEGAWLDYRWWTDPEEAPTFARTVDIHRKPGYDPLELFWDRAANGTAIDPSLIHGSHGRVHEGEAVFIAAPGCTQADVIRATEVADALEVLLAL